MSQVEELEGKIQEMAEQDRKNTQQVLELTNVKARLARNAAAKVIIISLHRLSTSRHKSHAYACT